MHRSRLHAATTLFLILIVCSTAFGQSEPSIYVEVDYMRSLSPDYTQIESEIWKPLHEERIERGQMLGWALYGVRFGDQLDYDYITVNLYDSMEDVLNFGELEDLVGAAHPNRPLEEVTESLQSRQIVRSELWTLVDGIDLQENQTRPRFLILACMNVPSGGEEAYVNLEREVWKPIHEAAHAQSGIARWGLYMLNWPSGSDVACQYGTANEYSDVSDGPSYEALAEEIHADRSWDELLSETMESREVVSSIFYELVDSTD